MTEKHSPLPCPFCGKLPENDKDAYVHCANAECPVCVEAYGTEAVASWNTRAVNGLPEAIAALEEIAGWRDDTLGPRPKERGPYDCAPEITAAFDNGTRMAFYRCADRARAALTKLKG